MALVNANFFWELADQSKMFLLMSMPVGFVIGIVATRREHERFDKSRTMIVGASMTFVFIVGPIVLRLMDFFPTNDSPLLTPLLVVFGVASGIGGLAVVSASSLKLSPVHEFGLKWGQN